MSRSALNPSTPVRVWIASFLFLVGGMWLLLMLREYWFNVASPESTAGGAEEFYRPENLIRIGIALAAVLLSIALFLIGQVNWSRRRRYYREHRRHSHSSRRVDLPTPRTEETAEQGTDEQPAAAPNRIKVRRRVRVRKPC